MNLLDHYYVNPGDGRYYDRVDIVRAALSHQLLISELGVDIATSKTLYGKLCSIRTVYWCN
jgi:hypothetical protein